MKRVFSILKSFGDQTKEDNINAFASSSAFFIFLSLIPLIMLLFSIIPYTPINPELIKNWLLVEFPGSIGETFVSIVDEVLVKSWGIISISAIATLWSAGKGINSLIAGFNAVDGYVDKRNSILLRLISMLYTVIFIVGVIIFLFLMVGGSFLLNNILVLFPVLQKLLEILLPFRLVMSIALFSVIFMLCYSLLPYKKHKFRETFPGAIISALAWTGFSYLFSLYVDKFDAFSMYGSLTAIIVLLIWLYTCMYIVFIGDNLNKYFSPVISLIFKKGAKIEDFKNELKNLDD